MKKKRKTKLIWFTWIEILNTSSQQVQESKLSLENLEAEGLHWHQTPLLTHRAPGRATGHPSVLNLPQKSCAAAAGRVGTLTGEWGPRRRDRRHGWLPPCPALPSPASPLQALPGKAPWQYLWELRTPPWKDIENFKHTHLSRLLSGKVTWHCLTASVFYWSKL